jgi:hypothetical protein
MKKILMSFILLCASSTLQAQRPGLIAGLNVTDMLLKSDEGNFSSSSKTALGGQFGLLMDFSLSENISLETGIIFGTKGYRVKEKYNIYGYSYSYTGRLLTVYGNVPVAVKYTHNLENLKIYGLFGPDLGVGIYGRVKFTSDVTGDKETEKDDVAWGTNEEKDDLKRLDIGAKVGAGIEWKSFQFGLNYIYGISNIATNGTMKNRVFNISVCRWLKSN